MDSKCGAFNISYVHVNSFEELVRVVGCCTLSTFGDWGKVPYRGWWCATNGEVAMLSRCDDGLLVPEA